MQAYGGIGLGLQLDASVSEPAASLHHRRRG